MAQFRQLWPLYAIKQCSCSACVRPWKYRVCLHHRMLPVTMLELPFQSHFVSVTCFFFTAPVKVASHMTRFVLSMWMLAEVPGCYGLGVGNFCCFGELLVTALWSIECIVFNKCGQNGYRGKSGMCELMLLPSTAVNKFWVEDRRCVLRLALLCWLYMLCSGLGLRQQTQTWSSSDSHMGHQTTFVWNISQNSSQDFSFQMEFWNQCFFQGPYTDVCLVLWPNDV